MNSINVGHHDEGLTQRQAALIAGFGYLLMPVTYAEFSLYPSGQTVVDIAMLMYFQDGPLL